jgi:hypothetical protein
MKRMAATGFLIWALATIALRLGGQYVFGRLPALLLLLITIPLMIALASAVLQSSRLPEQRALAAIALVAPGMLLDTISAVWFPTIFPNISPDAAGTFAGWLLLCNVVVLLTAVWHHPTPRAAA